jgi:purine-binding chemotaxis protein CheW
VSGAGASRPAAQQQEQEIPSGAGASRPAAQQQEQEIPSGAGASRPAAQQQEQRILSGAGEAVSEGITVATFWVDGLLLGIDIDHVQEVLRGQDVSPVPLADPAILGLLNLRGRLAATIDLRHRLGLTPRPAGEPVVHVILRTGGDPVGLVVDREAEVVPIGPGAVEPVPETIETTIRTLVTGAHQCDGSLLLLLDAHRAVALPAPNREAAHAGPGR